MNKLRFIERHYRRGVEPFTTIKQKIEEGEEPYDPSLANYDPGDGEPPFTSEWIEADESQNIVGYSCLGLVQSALLEYLREYLRERRSTLPNGNGLLLIRYKSYFREHFGIDWEDAPVDLKTLEDLTLARNHIQHETKLTMRYARQSEKYASRFPNSLFGGDFRRIRVTEEGLTTAIRAVEQICNFIERR